MSVFKEGAWDTDETGDKLTKDLFLGKKQKNKRKKIKAVKNITKNNEKSIESDEKKSRNDLNASSSNFLTRNKSENKKRKSGSIEINGTVTKKRKSETDEQNVSKKFEKTLRKKVDRKLAKLADRSNGNSDAAVTKKKINPESNGSKKRRKLNDNNSEIDTKEASPLTKSQKRRLKYKRKLMKNSIGKEQPVNGTEESKEGSLLNSDNLNKSGLKIDRLQRLLMDKQRRGSRNGLKTAEPKSLRDRMMARLKSSRFRYLNEQMYNSESWSSKKYFNEDPDAFVAYHEGYKLQVDQWPLNPLDSVIASLKKLPKDYVVADFGCGEARLADSVVQKVHSLDLVAINDKVTACDMAHTSLLSGRIDVVVFCLSLMGTNLTDYLIEANRVLREDGILKIAEVESRFEDVDEFVKILGSYGFVNTWKDLSHNLFYFMDFKKSGDIAKKRNKLPPLTLKSCLYKRR